MEYNIPLQIIIPYIQMYKKSIDTKHSYLSTLFITHISYFIILIFLCIKD